MHKLSTVPPPLLAWLPAPPPLPKHPKGIFIGTENDTKITCTDRSPNGQVITIGDCCGRVRLYRYPCSADRPPVPLFHELKGHGAGSVSRARFLRGGKLLVTIGASDRQVRTHAPMRVSYRVQKFVKKSGKRPAVPTKSLGFRGLGYRCSFLTFPATSYSTTDSSELQFCFPHLYAGLLY